MNSKHIFSSVFALSLFVGVLTSGCKSNSPTSSTSTDSTKDSTHRNDSTFDAELSTKVTFYDTNYDNVRGGVQITLIAPDQSENYSRTGISDEWIELTSTGTTSIKGWWLNAGDYGQNYMLPDTIYGKLRLFTHFLHGGSKKYEYSLGVPDTKWIWNNADPDTAILFNDKMQVVSTFTYKKR